MTTLGEGARFSGRYTIRRLIKSGGSGAVYEAVADDGSACAIKVLHERFGNDPDMKKRFAQEAPLTDKLQSGHIVRILATGEEPTLRLPWIAMELLQGHDLEEEFKARKRKTPAKVPLFSQDEVFAILDQIADGLAVSHAENIVHRDLKFENIFYCLQQFDPTPLIKILDFGLAKPRGDLSGALGTPHWAAPEQFDPGEPRPTMDIWAFGLIAFRLFTGHFYFKASDANPPKTSTLLPEIQSKHHVPATVRAKEYGCLELLPPGFDLWFAHCVVRDPERRFANAEMARRELAQIRYPTQPVSGVIDSGHISPVNPASRPQRFDLPPSDNINGESTSQRNWSRLSQKLKERRRYLWLVVPLVFLGGAGAWQLHRKHRDRLHCQQAREPEKNASARSSDSRDACQHICSSEEGWACETYGDLLKQANADSGQVQAAYHIACSESVTGRESTACLKEAELILHQEHPMMQDGKRARDILKTICESASPEKSVLSTPVLPACLRLGQVLMSEAPPDEVGAELRFRDSCERGEDGGRGCYEFGQLHSKRKLPENASKARAAYSKGCEKGNRASCLAHAKMRLRGEGLAEPERNKTGLLVKEACEALRAIEELCPQNGKEELEGECRLTLKDGEAEGKALAELRESCRMNSGPVSARHLGELYRAGQEFHADSSRAERLFNTACEQSDGRACYLNAQLFKEQGKLTRASKEHLHACKLGVEEACGLTTSSGRQSLTREEDLIRLCEVRHDKSACRQLCASLRSQQGKAAGAKMYCALGAK